MESHVVRLDIEMTYVVRVQEIDRNAKLARNRGEVIRHGSCADVVKGVPVVGQCDEPVVVGKSMSGE
jgi:hypothetical protein